MRRAWMVMWAVYFASLAVVINQFKVPPVMHILLKELDITMAQGGWMMSVFFVAGVLLSLPAAFFNDKFGPKTTGIIALACTAMGSIIGGFSVNLEILLIGRIIEGIGFGVIAVVAPAVIAMWFPPEKRGLPMGIWASWVPVGSFIMFNLAYPIQSYLGWHGVWWFGTVVALVALTYYAIVVTTPLSETMNVNKERSKAHNQIRTMIEGLKHPNAWLLGLAFAGFGFATNGFTSFAPQYFNQVHGVFGEKANFYASLSPMMSIFSTIIAGWVIVKLRNTKLVLVVSAGLTMVLYAFAFRLPSASWIIPTMLLMGFVPGFIATANFTLAPETMPTPALIGFALGINNLLFNLGSFFGPPIIGNVISQGNWSSGTYPLALAFLVTFFISLFLYRVLNKSKKCS